MADKKVAPGEKFPSQEWFTERIANNPETRPSLFTSQAVGYNSGRAGFNNLISGGMLGTGDEVVSGYTGKDPEFVKKVTQAAADINPLSYRFGQAVGFGAEAIPAAYGLVKTATAPVVEAGYQAAARYAPKLVEKLPTLAGVAAAGGAAVDTAYDWLYPPAKPQQAAAPQEAPPKQDEPAKPVSYEDFWAGQLGMRPADVGAMAKKYGGIPISALQQLAATRGRAPTYRDRAMSGLMDVMEAQGAQVLQQGTAEQKTAFINNYAKLMSQIMGVDPLGQQTIDNMGGEEK